MISRSYRMFFLIVFAVGQMVSADPIVVGSKKFTESVILGEIVTQALNGSGISADHQSELGGTRILWNALQSGEIDCYPEYTGTIMKEILSQSPGLTAGNLSQALSTYGVRMSKPLGFNNTYALGVTPETAKKYDLHRISDMRDHPELRFGFTNEFMDRADGWPGLRDHYRLPQTDVRGLDHDLAYRGLNSGSIDVMDLYSTDAEIAYYNLVVLEDDLHYFPEYRAVILFGNDPKLDAGFQKINKIFPGSIHNRAMIKLNAAVKIDGKSEKSVASAFLKKNFGINWNPEVQTRFQRIVENGKDHLILVIISLGLAILVSIPLGVYAAKFPRFGQVILGVVGVIQTIPSLALLVFMIPLLGIGGPPAIVALFLYSLLPIVRNTYSGLHDIPGHILESAHALGLPSGAILRKIEIPLALRSILSGIKTSAVINVGTATLGALIGAGGYGQPILTGIRLDDTALILEGAIPAAILALLIQGMFDLLERLVVSKGIQYEKAGTE